MKVSELLNESTEENDDVFKIPEHNYPTFERKIAQLNKAAAKIGSKPITYKIIKEQQSWRYRTEEHMHLDIKTPMTIFHVQVKGEAPKYEGWKFVAILDHSQIEGEVVLSPYPGETVPQYYYNADPRNCDHCRKLRGRAKTYIIKKTTPANPKSNKESERAPAGAHMQIGSACLKDFLGHKDPKAIAMLMGYVEILRMFEGGDEDESERTRRMPEQYDIESILRIACAIEITDGFVTRKQEYEAMERGDGATATSTLVQQYLARPGSSKEERKWREKVEAELAKKSDKPQKIIEWAKEKFGGDAASSSDYAHNVSLVIRSGVVTPKLMGVAVSLVGVYNRDEKMKADAALADKKRADFKNEHIGEPGGKLPTPLEVEITNIQYREGFNGSVQLITMVTDDGNTLQWGNNGENMEFEKGQRVTIERARIKKDNPKTYQDGKTKYGGHGFYHTRAGTKVNVTNIERVKFG